MQSSTKKIDDFGIKIGGARKDLWRERGGLQYEDLQGMNDLEIQQYVVKKEIWNLKPKDFENMVFVEGRDREAAYFIKKVYGAIPSKPKIPTYLTRKEDISKQLKAYIDMIQGIKKACYEIKTKEDIEIPTKDGTTTIFYQKFLPLFAPNQEHFGRVIRLYDEYTIQVSSKLFSAFQTPIFTLQREIKKAKFCYTEDEKIKATYSVKMFSSIEKSGTLFPKNVSNEYNDYGGTFIYKIGGNVSSIFCCNSFKDTTNVEDYIDHTYILLNENGQIIDYNFDTVEEAYQKAKIYDNEKQKYAGGKGNSGRKKKYIPKQFETLERQGRTCWEAQKSEGIQKIEEMISKDFHVESINKNSLNHIMMRQDSVWLTYSNLKRECGMLEKNNIYTKEVYTDFYKDAQKMDKSWAKTDNGYWASTCEMLARAGAAYLYEKAKEKGIKNDYLLGHALNAVNDVECGTLFLYPKGEEMRIISEKFDAFFDMLKEKELLKPLTEDEKSVGMLYTPIKIDEVKNIEDKSDDMIIDEFGEFKLFDEEQHLPTTPFMESNQYEIPDVDYKNVCKAGKHKQEKKIEMPTLF